MANKEIKHTIRLEGEREYSAAIRDAQRNLRTLRSELKAETAELGANATAQQKNETRAKSLKAQIAEQEKVVETLRKALAEAKKDYGDNEDVVAKWEQKLNEARTTLANMQNGLAETENAMRGVSGATAEGVTATKSFADALENVSSVGESVSGAIESIFTGLISTVRDVVVDLWEIIGDTAAKANRWTDIAGYWNTDPATIQKWNYAIEDTGNNFEDLESIVTRLVLGGKGDIITEMLGISDVNYEDQWAYAMDVMTRLYELGKSGDLPENVWESIFGEKKATKAMDILNDWGLIRENLTTFDADNGGFGMNTDEIKTMNDVWVQINEIETKWFALKDEFAAGLGVITADLLVNVSGSLDALNEFMNADTEEEREAALEKLRKNIEEFFTKVAAAIRAGLEVVNQVGQELSESDDPIVSAIGNLLVSITDAGQWLIDNADKVKLALEIIFGVWLTTKLAEVAVKLTSIVADINTIKKFKDWTIPGSGVSNAIGTGMGAGAGESAGVEAGVKSIAGIGGAYDTIGAGLASNMFVALELFRHRIKREDIDAVADLAAIVDPMVHALPVALNQLAGGSSDRSPYTIGLKPVELQLDPNWSSGVDIMQNAADAGNIIADRIEQILTGGGTDQNGKNGLTSDDMGIFRGLPGQMKAAVISGMREVSIVLDGERVARALTPLVGGGIYRMVTE